jgi:hypothetical protein
VLLATAAAVRLVRQALSDSLDLHVYWTAVQYWVSGISPYHYTASDSGFVFKYPPWILPLLWPMSFLSFRATAILWLGLEFLCVGYGFSWLLKHKARLGPVILVTAAFWWIWMGHFSSGQFTLPLMAAGLGLSSAGGSSRRTRSTPSIAFMAIIQSAKVYTLACFLGEPRMKRATFWFSLLGMVALSLSILYWVSPLHQAPLPYLVSIFQDWKLAAGSGATELGESVVRGQGNHGFPALILRHLDPHGQRLNLDLLVAALLVAILGAAWKIFSKPISPSRRWVGWLALTVVVHPLAWHHSFVMTYPLCALALSDALDRKNKFAVVLAFFGLCCITLFIPQVIGHDLVRPLELAGIKSWGSPSVPAVFPSGSRPRRGAGYFCRSRFI